MDKVLDRITTAAGKMDVQLRWQQAEGDPVALVSIHPPRDDDEQLARIESRKILVNQPLGPPSGGPAAKVVCVERLCRFEKSG